MFRSATGIDISSFAIELALEKCRIRLPGAVFRMTELSALPFDDSSFNMVADRGCLHNQPLEKWGSYEGEVFRILKPGGIFLLRGARSEPSYRENFFFIESQNVHRHFPSGRWNIK